MLVLVLLQILVLMLLLMLMLAQRMAVERMEKLGEQLEEARKLRQSIFRRGDAVFAILSRSVFFIHPSKLAIFFVVKVNTRIILVVNQVPGPTLGRTIWRIHKGEDPPDRGDQAAVRVAQGGGGVDQVPQGVHRQQRHDHLILIR